MNFPAGLRNAAYIGLPGATSSTLFVTRPYMRVKRLVCAILFITPTDNCMMECIFFRFFHLKGEGHP